MRKGEIRKQAILSVSDQLFCAKGYQETTIEDILAELGCSKGSFYHHFDSKLSVLSALCQERVRHAFELYEKGQYKNTPSRFNALLYYAQPFRTGEEAFLGVLLSLRALGEGDVMDAHIRRARRDRFKPEFSRLLMTLHETGAARTARIGLDSLAFEALLAYLDESLGIAAGPENNEASNAGRLTEALGAARFLLERLLDMPYGSIEIVSLKEMAEVYTAALHSARMRESPYRPIPD